MFNKTSYCRYKRMVSKIYCIKLKKKINSLQTKTLKFVKQAGHIFTQISNLGKLKKKKKKKTKKFPSKEGKGRNSSPSALTK